MQRRLVSGRLTCSDQIYMEQKEKSDVNLLFKLKNKNDSWVFSLKKKWQQAHRTATQADQFLLPCWIAYEQNYGVIIRSFGQEPGFRAIKVSWSQETGANLWMVLNPHWWVIFLWHFPTFLESVIPCSPSPIFFLIVCYIPLVTQLSGENPNHLHGLGFLYYIYSHLKDILWCGRGCSSKAQQWVL